MAPLDLLAGLLTPDEIAERISASSGIHLTGRTVWEKAKRLGIAKKIGRSMLIAIDDIPALLQEERKIDRMERRCERSAMKSSARTLSKLRRERAKK
ncbi:hypothetical protein [Rhizobium lusitanum]|uniref:hypothetical protein n=1 Tax=Rhizobium lusitanum TaxID=293958 RepID=UPI0019575877|nr:hypothetical protein [Rhizobium lusitanum]MBM7045216.1 hypothetical protein [Rhizobium lusitanum]